MIVQAPAGQTSVVAISPHDTFVFGHGVAPGGVSSASGTGAMGHDGFSLVADSAPRTFLHDAQAGWPQASFHGPIDRHVTFTDHDSTLQTNALAEHLHASFIIH
jgi:hypothetical protein